MVNLWLLHQYGAVWSDCTWQEINTVHDRKGSGLLACHWNVSAKSLSCPWDKLNKIPSELVSAGKPSGLWNVSICSFINMNLQLGFIHLLPFVHCFYKTASRACLTRLRCSPLSLPPTLTVNRRITSVLRSCSHLPTSPTSYAEMFQKDRSGPSFIPAIVWLIPLVLCLCTASVQIDAAD